MQYESLMSRGRTGPICVLHCVNISMANHCFQGFLYMENGFLIKTGTQNTRATAPMLITGSYKCFPHTKAIWVICKYFSRQN